MSFHVGQLVCCIDDRRYLPADGLVKGRVYVVQRTDAPVLFDCDDGLESHQPVWLEGECRGPSCGWPDTPFAAYRFRPLDDTRLSVFREMLAPKPTKVSA